MTEEQIVDIWTGLKEFFDKKAIDAVASRYVDILADNGVADHVLRAALGSDDDLDDAIEYYLDEDSTDDYEEDIDYDSEEWDDD